MEEIGYRFSSSSRSHYALDSFILNYTNHYGNRDNIKIEINYIDRLHIFNYNNVNINNHIININNVIRVLEKHELFGSKLTALISRCKPRDLYDIYSLIHSDIKLDLNLLKKCAIFYNCVGGSADLLENTFFLLDNIDYSIIRQYLKPVISKKEKFDYRIAVVEVKQFLKDLFVFTNDEKKFIQDFKNKIYNPHLLFEKEIADKIIDHPMAQWKIITK